MTARNKLLGFLSKNADMLTPQQAARVEAMSKVAGPVSALGVVGGSAAPVEVVEAFKRLHGAWLLASHRSDMNEQMDALATALHLDPYTLAPLNVEISHDRERKI